ncbi:MAG: zinc ribbon protein [Chloroflexi bacterium]|jgi:putative FmdB family regulatory protein|nr:zinc ribbon protein [Chloroflexota bacterium]
MPVYEYRCNDCNRKFELFVPHRMTTDGVVCRDCHSPKVQKLVSSFASIGGESETSYAASEPVSGGGGCCGGAGGCACGH